MHHAPSIDNETVETIARDADADPRSVVRRLAGLPVKGRPGRRIDDALARRRRAQANPPSAKTA